MGAAAGWPHLFLPVLFAILLPHSIKGARHAWMAAGFLWLAKLAIERKRPFPQLFPRLS